MKQIYLDNAATTQPDNEVASEVYFATKEFWGNPSSGHKKGEETKAKIEECRASIAANCGCKPEEIIFTSGGSEADNIALRRSVADLGVKTIITSPVEHKAVLQTAKNLADEGVAVEYVALDGRGHVDLNSVEALLKKSKQPTLVSLMAVNNETGNLLDINTVAALSQKHGALLHSDTVQYMGLYPANFGELRLDFAAASAHKFYGTKGIGFLFKKAGHKIGQLITGGGQERGIRGGTENVPGIIALAKSLELSVAKREEGYRHAEKLKRELIRLLKLEIPGVWFNGDAEDLSSPAIVNVSLPKRSHEPGLLKYLSDNGIYVSGGSACNTGSPSHVLQAIGADLYRENMRVSFGKKNTMDDIMNLLDAVLGYYGEKHSAA